MEGGGGCLTEGSLGSSAGVEGVGEAGGWEIKSSFYWRVGELLPGKSFALQGRRVLIH